MYAEDRGSDTVGASVDPCCKYKKACAGAHVISSNVLQIVPGSIRDELLIGQGLAWHDRRQVQLTHQEANFHGLPKIATGRTGKFQ